MRDLNTLIGRMFKQLTTSPKSPHRTTTTFLGQNDTITVFSEGFIIQMSKAADVDSFWADDGQPFDIALHAYWDLAFWRDA